MKIARHRNANRTALIVVLGMAGACVGAPSSPIQANAEPAAQLTEPRAIVVQTAGSVEARASHKVYVETVSAETGPVATGPANNPAQPTKFAQLTEASAPRAASALAAPAFSSSGHAAFDAWRTDFARRSIANGYKVDIVESVLRGLKPLEIYLPSNPERKSQNAVSEQAEFAKPIWDYVRTAVSDTRKSTGQAKISELSALLDALETRYQVDRFAIAAIWGMETNFGGYIGDFDGPETLANMAVEGRRRAFAERELLATMKIIERGDARRDQLVAGWAGAMGQTQFMPSVFLARAVDWDGDGIKDIWASQADALASAANYLALSGYRMGDPWGVEIIVPDNFDYSLADGTKRPLASWIDRGVHAKITGVITAGGAQEARLWFPAGADGPGYLIFANFDVFLDYNRANAYALSVGLLADAIEGKPGPQSPWPTDTKLLSVGDVKLLQASLNRQGYAAGPTDGIAGSGTRRALQRWQKDKGFRADGFPTRDMLTYVRGAEPQ